jgi:nucleotide-binding universal stress UspA family protein
MTVVVGVDGIPGSDPAIRLALQEARYRSTRLLAVMAYGPETVLGAPAARPVSTGPAPAEQRGLTEATLRQAVEVALGDLPADVELRTVQGNPGRALVETARESDAQLLVLSARDDGPVSRLLGTVSQYVLRQAPSPVLVVPAGI